MIRSDTDDITLDTSISHTEHTGLQTDPIEPRSAHTCEVWRALRITAIKYNLGTSGTTKTADERANCSHGIMLRKP